MSSSCIRYTIRVCLVIVTLTVSTSHSWNPDYYYDETPFQPYYFDTNEPVDLNQFKITKTQRSQCNCIKLKECTVFILQLRAAPKPLSSAVMKDIRKKACGFAGVDPLICCPSADILPRNFREVTTEKPWIWDVSNSQKKSSTKIPTTTQPSNIFNRLNPDTINLDQHRNPNDIHSSGKKLASDKKYFPYKTKTNQFFDFEDPHTFQNCPPSFSPDFRIPPQFQHVKPFKNVHHASNKPNHSFDFNNVDNEPNFIFPNADDVPTFPSRVAKYSLEKLNLINAENCGISINQRIIGGDDAVPGQFPWLSRLAYKNRTSQLVSFRCSGSVISKKYVLTAAHCVTNLVDDLELVYVRLGELDSNSNSNEPQDYEIESIVHHQSYDVPKYGNDIALIRLRQTTNSSGVSPLCLPIGSYETADKNRSGNVGIVAGWSSLGVSSPDGTANSPMLQYLQLPIIDTRTCADSYARFSANSRTPIIINESQLCAQGTENHDACQGDSGGPLMASHKSGRFILLGLVSFGPRSCGIHFPGVYSRISHHLDWILNNIQP